MIAQGKKTVADIAKALKARPSSMPFVPIRSSKTFAGRRIALTALSLQTHSDSLSCQVFHAVWYKTFLADAAATNVDQEESINASSQKTHQDCAADNQLTSPPFGGV